MPAQPAVPEEGCQRSSLGSSLQHSAAEPSNPRRRSRNGPGSRSTPRRSCCSGRCCSVLPSISWTGGSRCTPSSASPWCGCYRSCWPCSACACVAQRSPSSGGSGPAGLPRSCSCCCWSRRADWPRALMLTVVTWTVALSVFAHGLTAWPRASRYADWYEAHSHHHASMPESAGLHPAHEACPGRRAPSPPGGQPGHHPAGVRPGPGPRSLWSLGLALSSWRRGNRSGGLPPRAHCCVQRRPR
jgi:hypothetical protein